MVFEAFLRVNQSTERLTESMGKGKLERTLRSSFFLPSAGPDDEAKPWQPQPITKTLEAEKRLIRFCAKIYFHFYVNP